MDMYTQLYLKWIIKKDLLYSTGNSAQCYMAAWMGGEFGREWIPVCVWLSPFSVHLKPSQHCWLIGYTPVQNKTKFLNPFRVTQDTTQTPNHGLQDFNNWSQLNFPAFTFTSQPYFSHTKRSAVLTSKPLTYH